MSILEGWEALIESAEALEVDGPALEITFESRLDMQYALVALVVFNSKQELIERSWGYSLLTQGNTLFISKVSTHQI
jgi:hypothetical protein